MTQAADTPHSAPVPQAPGSSSLPARTGATEPLRHAVSKAYLADESDVVRTLIAYARLSGSEKAKTNEAARNLVQAVRSGRRKIGGVDAFMHEYSLSSEEGVVLMCLAEALLRVPDAETADKLIKDKVAPADWQRHLGHSEDLFVNASTWGLMLTGRVVKLPDLAKKDFSGFLSRLISKSGEPIIRQAMLHAMRVMGKQFVLGRTIAEAMKEAKPQAQKGVRFSFDMLGEAAYTMADADRYYAAYHDAIEAVGLAAARDAHPDQSIFARPSISVKLSAIHPRYSESHRDRVMNELAPRLQDLAALARHHKIGLTVDAEEADRLDLSLDVFERVAASDDVMGWDGFGLALQAYQKRAFYVIDWLAALARRQGRRIPLRLVKGAYWDTEIKRHQVWGADGYPVFTRKVSTDVSYLACARKILSSSDAFYAQFASHNAHTVAAVESMAENAGPDVEFEFQRLHGMGEALYDEVLKGAMGNRRPLRIYAPVGSHEDLLAYLVRRLLENGANTSFVNRLADDESPIEEIVADPIERAAALSSIPHPRIPLPKDLYGTRKNSRGLILSDNPVRSALMGEIAEELATPIEAGPLIDGRIPREGTVVRRLTNPANRTEDVGRVAEADARLVDTALTSAVAAQPAWDGLGGPQRADILDKVADLYEANMARLMGLCVREAGKSLDNAQNDVREAIDFLRYYAKNARTQFGEAQRMAGPTGERNDYSLHGRGVFACISPWNFPVAIFTGQVAAALAAGNAVIAKPAEQTPLVAFEAVRLFHKAGVPGEVLHFLPGDGAQIGGALVKDPRVAGVAFTGSTDTARLIAKTLAERPGPIAPLIAETGGQNAMIVDSTALPEQVVRDVVASAFDSAGQRCSACRVLFVQKDVADKVIRMLSGAMAELHVGDPWSYATDVGPVIDEEAQAMLEAHAARMADEGKVLFETPLGPDCASGTFFAPRLIEIDSLDVLEKEVFGPVLHVVRYAAKDLGKVVDAINKTGYGLTLGVHSRIEETMRFVRARAKVGNLYVNRNQIGAVVGVQPFGGEGLSGTGPKAGGPTYLYRFAVERVVSIDTTAAGGNAALMSMEEGAD